MTHMGKLTNPVWILALFLIAILIPRAALAQDTNRAGLVVIHDDGRTTQQCISFSESEITGLQVLELSGLDLNYNAQNSLGATICRIDGAGCSYPQEDCFCQCLEPPCKYWSYWYRSDGDWFYSSVGASNRRVRNGDMEAWVWSEGTLNTSADRRPPEDVVFDTVCLPPTATPTVTPTATGTSIPTATPIPTVESATTTPTMTAHADANADVGAYADGHNNTDCDADRYYAAAHQPVWCGSNRDQFRRDGDAFLGRQRG